MFFLMIHAEIIKKISLCLLVYAPHSGPGLTSGSDTGTSKQRSDAEDSRGVSVEMAFTGNVAPERRGQTNDNQTYITLTGQTNKYL